MAKELLIRKQKGTHSPQCTSYRIVESAWRFTLETCDEDVTGVIKDDVGNTIATVSAGAPAIVSRLGLYNVCVTGNGMGALYVEWTSDTYVDQQCCNEVRKEFEQMLDDAIANVESKIPSATVTVRSGENTEVTKSGNTYTVNATDTVTTLKAGNGISLQRNGYEYTVSSKVANIVAGENVSIQEGTESDGSPRFEISAVDTKPDVTKAYVDEQIAAIVDKDTVTIVNAGENVSVSDTGTGGNHNYTISAVDTVTTVKAGNNVSVSKSGDEYTVSATDTVTTVKAGNNVSVSKSGNEYTVSATGGSSTDTVTTLVAGDGISISDSGTGGNHNYTVTATNENIIKSININLPLSEIKLQAYQVLGTLDATVTHNSFDADTVKPSLRINSYDNNNLYGTLTLGSRKSLDTNIENVRFVLGSFTIPPSDNIIVRTNTNRVPIVASYTTFSLSTLDQESTFTINGDTPESFTSDIIAPNNIVITMYFIYTRGITFRNDYGGIFYVSIPRSFVDIDNQ